MQSAYAKPSVKINYDLKRTYSVDRYDRTSRLLGSVEIGITAAGTTLTIKRDVHSSNVADAKGVAVRAVRDLGSCIYSMLGQGHLQPTSVAVFGDDETGFSGKAHFNQKVESVSHFDIYVAEIDDLTGVEEAAKECLLELAVALRDYDLAKLSPT